jgi:hypothetical protein
MNKQLFSDIDLFIITTNEPSFEPSCKPSYEPTYMITMNNTFSSLSNNEIINYEKKFIIIFTTFGGLILVFMLIILFFHIKSRLIYEKEKEDIQNNYLDILQDSTNAVSIVNNDTQV